MIRVLIGDIIAITSILIISIIILVLMIIHEFRNSKQSEVENENT